jgi:hypothetical protein
MWRDHTHAIWIAPEHYDLPWRVAHRLTEPCREKKIAAGLAAATGKKMGHQLDFHPPRVGRQMVCNAQ